MNELRERMQRLSPEEFNRLRELLRQRAGLKLADDARDMVERRLRERVDAHSLGGFGEYCARLYSGTLGMGELERAIELLTTNETYFFRELSQLRAFERDILPALVPLTRVQRSLTVWSAGCSSGEEVYSIAILIARSGLFADCNVRVIGSDISQRVLQTARKGVYRGASFRALPPEYERYFADTPDGRAVVPAVRALCQFGQLNLFDASRVVMVGRVDVVFCRNVLIYFDDESRKKALATFYERLQPGGYLLLGHAESLLLSNSPFQLAQLGSELAYRKPASGFGTRGQP